MVLLLRSHYYSELVNVGPLTGCACGKSLLAEDSGGADATLG